MSCSRVDVAWSGSNDPGGSGVAGYRVYRNSAFLKQVTATATSTSDMTATAATAYGYQVSALDNAGNESTRSTMANASTPPCVAGGAYQWSRQMGGEVLADAVVPYAIAIDGGGNILVTGSVYGTVNFGPIGATSEGRSDMFVAKYSAAGVPQWVRRFGDDNEQFGTAVGTDASGNVYVIGYFFGAVDFGGGLFTSQGYDVVLAKYNANGTHQWSKQLGGASYEIGQALVVDGGSNVLIGGQFSGTADLGGGPLTSAGGYDLFLAKYTANGAHVWSKRMGGSSLDVMGGLGVDAQGNPTAVGQFLGTANFGGANLTSAGGNDLFVTRYSAAGAHQWSNRFGDVNDQWVYGAAVDAAGNVVLTGSFYGAFSFGGSPLPSTGGGADIFLAKLNAAGAHQWSRSYGTANNYGEVGEAVAIDGAGNVVLTGEIIRDVNFGGGVLAGTTITYDPFVAKFDSAGVHQWSKRFVAEWDDQGTAVAVDASGNIVLGGGMYQGIDFGGGVLASPGGTDGFLVKVGP